MSAPLAEKFMTKDVLRVGPDCPVPDVLQDLSACAVSCVMVCEGDFPIGIITERDVVQVAANLTCRPEEVVHTAEEMMSSPLTSVRESDPIQKAIELAQRSNVRHLPVVDSHDRLAGLLTQSDLARALAALASPAADDDASE